MTDIEINQTLALAIGYLPEHVRVWDTGKSWIDCVEVFRPTYEGIAVTNAMAWSTFNYMDWTTIARIAERYDMFPMVAACHADQWAICTDKVEVFADTPQKAIALAVIGAKK